MSEFGVHLWTNVARPAVARSKSNRHALAPNIFVMIIEQAVVANWPRVSSSAGLADLRGKQICTGTARPVFWFFPKQAPRGASAYKMVLLRGAILYALAPRGVVFVFSPKRPRAVTVHMCLFRIFGLCFASYAHRLPMLCYRPRATPF